MRWTYRYEMRYLLERSGLGDIPLAAEVALALLELAWTISPRANRSRRIWRAESTGGVGGGGACRDDRVR
jgi:hypothetical protein